jgi:hypothetical protein
MLRFSIIVLILAIGLVSGAQWHRAYIFPFPQLRGLLTNNPNLEIPPKTEKMIVTRYSKESPVFLDRLYFDSVGDARLDGLYTIRMPRHYSGDISIESSKDLIIYRAVSNDNNNTYLINWELSDVPINVIGKSTTHTKIFKKLFSADKAIKLSAGGPIASDPIFIQVLNYIEPIPSFRF